MANPTLQRRPVLPSLLLPPIGGIPAPARQPVRVAEPDPVGSFATRTRSWARLPKRLPDRVSIALWLVLTGAGGFGGWLVAERAWTAPRGGVAYSILTLGHPGLLLVLAAICVVTLLVLAPFTGGLTRAGGPEVAVMTVAGIAGVGALLGVVALVLLSVLAGFLTLAAIIAAFERN